MNKRLPLFAMCAIAVAACTPQVVKDASPPIGKTVGRLDEPSPNKLVITPSEPVAPDPDKALENYRELLKLQPDPDTKSEAMRRLADLQVQVQDTRGQNDDTERSLKESIKLYNQLLDDHPEDEHNDRVFYQLARAYQNVGDSDAAIDTLKRLTERHPNSDLVGDAHFRRAEMLFYKARFADAEEEYHQVMDLADKTPFFEPAQYKYGWSLYKQAKYEAALDTFFAILDRELPSGEQSETDAALSGVQKGKLDMAKDSLRVVTLSLTQMGGGQALSDYFAKKGDPRFYPLVYAALGEMYLEKQRYTDAATAYTAFIDRYPKSARAPAFQTRVIAAFGAGGFHDLVAREKEKYVTTYDPQAPYWAGATPTAEVMGELRKHLEDLAKHYHARAQANKDPNDFLVAAKWYRRIIDVYPRDPALPEINFLLGDALLDGGHTLEAAQEYTKTGYDYPPHPRAGEAAYAAVLAYQKNAKDVPAEQRGASLRLAIDSSVRMADKFPGHAQVYPVLTQTAEDLYELKSYDEAIKIASRVIKADRPVAFGLRKTAWSVTGDAQFAQKRYPDAEVAYTEELKLTPEGSPERAEITEQVAASIYKQGELARDAKDLRAAATQFLRVGQVTPTAKIRANADYDGATMLLLLEDWSAATGVLEGFRQRFPGNALEPDVDKKLAVAYQKDNKPAQAAGAYRRIASRGSESMDTRREAGWLAATLFDQAHDDTEAGKSYEFYVNSFPSPLARAMDGRQRLVEISRTRGDTGKQMFWMREIVRADETAGPERTDRTRVLAAQASLDLGRFAAADVRALALTLPIEKSLPPKKRAMEGAIASLDKAAGYGFKEITTAATYELGELYEDFAKSLMDSERPHKLSALELEQYNLLLEEQANPFEEKSIATHEANLKRIAQGIYDVNVAKSARALAKIAPARYGKVEQGEERYETLK
jgi:tetratricopeptide (TPR) repeat protein